MRAGAPVAVLNERYGQQPSPAGITLAGLLFCRAGRSTRFVGAPSRDCAATRVGRGGEGRVWRSVMRGPMAKTAKNVATVWS